MLMFSLNLYKEGMIHCLHSFHLRKKFRKVLHRLLSDILKREDDYIETPLIVEKVRLIV